MKVKQLIKMLSEYNKDADIIFLESANACTSVNSAYDCRACEPDIIIKVPIQKYEYV